MKIIRFGIIAAVILSAASLFTQADDGLLRNDHPDRYTVKRGDTLWDISSTFLTQPWLWPEIWHINKHIENPHLIFPGDVVKLAYIDGQPRLTVDRTYKVGPNSHGIDGTTKLQPQIRTSPLSEAIPAIPLEQINSFLSRNRIVEPGVLEAAPYVIAGQEKRLILGAGDRLYGRGEFAANIPNYGIYRQGVTYKDPDTGEVIGVQAIDMGAANMRALKDDIATLSVTQSTGDVRIGDRILPTEERLIESTFVPSKPHGYIYGKIIGVEEGVSQVGMLDVVAINRGDYESLMPGNVLAIYKRGEVVRDKLAPKGKTSVVTLPDERAGLMMVFQTFDRMSLALVLKADRGIKVGDYVRTP